MTSYPNEAPLQPQIQYVEKKTNGLAIAGFICSLLAPVLGLIFSSIALSQIKNDESQGGKSFAKAGLIISIIFVALIAIMIVLFVILYALIIEAILNGNFNATF